MKERSLKTPFASVALLISAACSAMAEGAPADARTSVQTCGRWFVDEQGRHHVDAFGELLIGWYYWEYGQGFKDRPFHSLLGRPYAEVIAGEPIKMRCSDAAFELQFRPLPEGGETVIWIPPGMRADVDKDVQFRLSAKSISQCKRDESCFLRFACPGGVESCDVIVNLPRK